MTDALILDLATEADTSRLGRALATLLRAGDAVLLEGAIGAGKSHLARAFIRALLGAQEEVPSPTFTLVQTYPAATEGGADIWHADLYRLSHPDDVLELGLEDAYPTAICLIEWPDRLGSYLPANPLRLRLEPLGEGRRAHLSPGIRPGFAMALNAALRAEALTDFVALAGWTEAHRKPLAGDASARRYERLTLPGTSAILMDAPPGQADSVADFARIDRHLRSLNLSAPAILAEDATAGFMLLEDLGDGLYPHQIAMAPAQELPLYEAATDVLLHLQAHPAPLGLPDLTALDWAEAAAMAIDFYRKAMVGDAEGRAEFVTVMAETLVSHADGPRVLILRDYHAENLLWLPDRTGLARVGLLDFQLAQMGQPGYDLVSLLQDARRAVPEAVEAAMIRRFAEGSGATLAVFQTAYAALGAQRALRILGIFARLAAVEGKTRYLPMIPHVWAQLQRNLAHPALHDLRTTCERLLPAPEPQKLEASCRAFH
jgi:hypothetical protein